MSSLHHTRKKAICRMTENMNYCSRHISFDQFKILIDFMAQHVELATGSARSLEARHNSKSLWIELTKMLNNSSSGTRKTSDGWSKYWSDYKNKLKNKVRLLKKRKKFGASAKNNISLTALEKRALAIIGPHFGKKISKRPYPMNVKLESHQENGHDVTIHSECSDQYSVNGDSNISENSSEFENESEEEPKRAQRNIPNIYPKWLIEVEKKRANADLSRSKTEEKRAIISEKNADAALVQAEALKKLAEAAITQADALVRIATVLESRGQREEILPM